MMVPTALQWLAVTMYVMAHEPVKAAYPCTWGNPCSKPEKTAGGDLRQSFAAAAAAEAYQPCLQLAAMVLRNVFGTPYAPTGHVKRSIHVGSRGSLPRDVV